ncbi:hypothetical protein HDU93_009378 [Gonapodya sp. JEL0774]|nr:hypothetical protein HDU93_009378 [Gonapodya sp. JEL0774]
MTALLQVIAMLTKASHSISASTNTTSSFNSDNVRPTKQPDRFYSDVFSYSQEVQAALHTACGRVGGLPTNCAGLLGDAATSNGQDGFGQASTLVDLDLNSFEGVEWDFNVPLDSTNDLFNAIFSGSDISSTGTTAALDNVVASAPEFVSLVDLAAFTATDEDTTLFFNDKSVEQLLDDLVLFQTNTATEQAVEFAAAPAPFADQAAFAQTAGEVEVALPVTQCDSSNFQLNLDSLSTTDLAALVAVAQTNPQLVAELVKGMGLSLDTPSATNCSTNLDFDLDFNLGLDMASFNAMDLDLDTAMSPSNASLRSLSPELTCAGAVAASSPTSVTAKTPSRANKAKAPPAGGPARPYACTVRIV